MHLDRDWVVVFPELNPGIFGMCFAVWKNIICVMFFLYFVIFYFFSWRLALQGKEGASLATLQGKKLVEGKTLGRSGLDYPDCILCFLLEGMPWTCDAPSCKPRVRAVSARLPPSCCLLGGGRETGGTYEWWGNKKSSSSSLRPEQIIRNQGAKAVTKQMCCIG